MHELPGVQKRLTDLSGATVIDVGMFLLVHICDHNGHQDSLEIDTRSFEANETFDYTYDGVRRVETGDNLRGERVSITYDAEGRETLKDLPNGITVTNTYDATGRQLTHNYLRPGGQVVSGFSHTYDANDFRTASTEKSGNTTVSTKTYTPDRSKQLISQNQGAGDGKVQKGQKPFLHM